MKVNYKIFRVIALLEAILMLVIVFTLSNKIDNQKHKIDRITKENIRLRLVEQDFQESKEYIYECYKQVSNNASDNAKGK